MHRGGKDARVPLVRLPILTMQVDCIVKSLSLYLFLSPQLKGGAGPGALLGLSWGRLGALLGHSWAVWGPSWTVSGPFGGPLGPSWDDPLARLGTITEFVRTDGPEEGDSQLQGERKTEDRDRREEGVRPLFPLTAVKRKS
eukprot:7880321-Pyramimonas_sp.AAC.1